MRLSEALAGVTSAGLAKIANGVERLDSWVNDVTGFGTPRDKTTYTAFAGVSYLSDQHLSNLYEGDDLASRAVDIVPDEMLREGFTVDLGDPEANKEIDQQCEALGVAEKFANGMRWGRLYGHGALLIGADDGRPAAEPLAPERADGVRYLVELDKRLLWPLTWYKSGTAKSGQPETFLITPASAYNAEAGYSVVHETRLIQFGGATTGIWEKAQNNGFDRSILQRAFEALRGFNTTYKAVEILVSDGNQAVFKMQGLAEGIGANGTERARARMQVIDMYRSVLRAIVVDAGDVDTGNGAEDFTRQTVSLTDYPATLDRFMLRLAAAVQIPATILYGQSPAGMNATGDADFRWFYNRIRSAQTRQLAPRIRRLVRIMRATKSIGKAAGDGTITVAFPNLWSEPPSTEATRKKTIAETDQIRINTGELLPEEVAAVRTQPDGWDREITISDEARKAREAVVSEANSGDEDAGASTVELAPTDIAKVVTVNEARKSQGLGALLLEDGTEDPDGGLTVAEFTAKREASATPVGPALGGFGAPPANPFEERVDASELLDQLKGVERIVIAGASRTGKSTTAARISERYGHTVRSTDSLVGEGHSLESEKASKWLDEEGTWVVEGTTMPRALRKWLKANPGKKLDATVVWLSRPMVPQSTGQKTQGKGISTVWNEIKGELAKRGIPVLERDR